MVMLLLPRHDGEHLCAVEEAREVGHGVGELVGAHGVPVHRLKRAEGGGGGGEGGRGRGGSEGMRGVYV